MSIEEMPQFNPTQKTPNKETPEREITPEQKELIESAIKFTEYLTDRWPQIDEIDDKETTIGLRLPKSIKTEPRMNYYLSGSLASMLLSRAEKFTEMDETQIPALANARTREIPESANKILASFARQIGDIDYVPTDFYKSKQSNVQNSYNKVGNEEYQSMVHPFFQTAI